MNHIRFLALLILFSWLLGNAASANSGPTGMTYHGRIIKPNGFPLDSSSVTFTLTVYNPSSACILRQEQHIINMANTDGVFALSLGAGVPTSNDPGHLFQDIFRNDLASISCGPGGPPTYAPSSGDTRRLRVTFDDGVEVVTISPDHFMRTVPYALVANTLEGLGRNDFLQVSSSDNLSQANLESVFTGSNYTALSSLIAGTSSLYAKAGDLPVSGGSLNLSGSGKDLIVRDTPASGDSAVNKDYVDSLVGAGTSPTGSAGGDLSGSYPNPSVARIQGDAVSATNPNNGEALVWTGGSSYVPTPILPLAGGTMAGAINMGTNNISNGGTFTASVLAGSTANIGALNVSGLSSFTGIASHSDIIDMNSNKITELAAPNVGTDAANKNYVDNLVSAGTTPTGTAGGSLSGSYPNPSIAANAVTTSEIAADTILAADIATDAVGSAEIAADAVGASELANNAVDTAAIQTDAVTTLKISDRNVTYAKIQDVRTARLVGRASALDGVMEEIALGTGLSFSGTTLNVTGSAPTGTAGGSLSGSYPNPSIAGNAVTTSEIAADTILAADIATDAVGSAEIAADAVGASELANNAVDTAAIANSNVTYAKIQDVSAASKLLGRGASAAGVVEELALGTGLSFSGTTLNVTGAAPTGTAGGSLSGSYPNPSIAGNAVTTSEIAADTILAADIATDAVGSAEIAADAVGASELADSAVDTNAIQNNAVTSGKLATTISDALWTADGSGNVSRATGKVGIGVTPSTDSLEVNGNVKAVAFISTSDRRLKKNIRDVEGLKVIEQLRGVRFNWIENDEAEIGFIAQEVEAVLPELVVTDSETGIKAVKYSNMVAPLLESVKELANMSRASEQDLANLRAIVASHNKRLAEHDRKIASLEERVQKLEELNKVLVEELQKVRSTKK